ncbi:MAG: AMP-binding protein [Caulobacteraceae bacterium]|nr:AMP-binding protein [Caulobacteraceae bacterium]
MTEPQPASLEHWAREKPDAPAMIEGDRVITWKEWNDAANRLAEGLAARGLVAGDVLVTRMQIRPEWPIASAAAGKLGLRLLGLNWRLTPAETRYVLTNSGAHAILCDDADPAALAPAFEGLPLKLAGSVDVAADGFVTFEELSAQAPAQPRFAARNPPLILYTSGTTGLPKGVVMGGPGAEDPEARRRLAEYHQSVAGSRSPRPDDVMMIVLPMHHGAGPGAIWGATARGAPMVFLRRFDPEEALRLIERHKVTAWTGVPTMYKRIAGLPPEVVAKYDVSSIRALGVGAAPVPYSLKEWIIATFGEVLSEGYGTTETGMLTALSSEMQRRKPDSSGLPHTHVHISIRNGDGAELAAGQEGEIWVKTPVVIRQYLNAKPLGPDTLDADGYFRTGDVGRLDEEGYLFITDRAKDMIVSGGVNIYPAEIEAAILTHPAVQDVAVIGVPNEEFGEEVKAFCELKPGQAAAPDDIAEHCKTALASYKRPRTIEIVAELPRNTMGKLLKRELRDPYWKGRERNV